MYPDPNVRALKGQGHPTVGWWYDMMLGKGDGRGRGRGSRRWRGRRYDYSRSASGASESV